eukprot:4541401-Alexandrium_andersonii.AAC.1
MAVLTLQRQRCWELAQSASGKSHLMVSALQPVTHQPLSPGATLHCSLVSASTRASASLATIAPRQWCRSTTSPAALAAARTARLARRRPSSLRGRTARSST